MMNSNGSNGYNAEPGGYPTFAQVVFEIYASPDASPIQLKLMVGESPEDLAAIHEGIQARVRAGDVCAWCTVAVIARHGEYSGMAVMGQVSTTSTEDFAQPENEDYEKLCVAAYERLIANMMGRYRTHVIRELSPKRRNPEGS